MTRAAIDLFRPAKRNRSGRILAPGTDGISSKTVADFPSEAALSDLDEASDAEPFQNVEVEVRATDRDKRGTGWAGIIREEGFKRLPMKLYPTVDAGAVADAQLIRGDVLVEYKSVAGVEAKPVRFHLLAIHEVIR